MFPWNQGEDGPTLKYAENTIYGDIRGGYTFALMQNGMNYDISLKQVIMLFHPKERLFFTVSAAGYMPMIIIPDMNVYRI